jgi:hypothetical protein
VDCGDPGAERGARTANDLYEKFLQRGRRELRFGRLTHHFA